MSEELVVRPIAKGLSRTIGEYTGLDADITYLLSRSGTRQCESCGRSFPFFTPSEFVEKLVASSDKDQLVDIDLSISIVGKTPEHLVEQILKRGYTRGRINGEEVRFEEWGDGELSSVAVTVDRLKCSASDLRQRTLAAFNVAKNLEATQIEIFPLNLKTPLGKVCPNCSSAALVPVSSGITTSSFKGATLNETADLVSQLDIEGRHPDTIIYNDIKLRLERAAKLGLATFKLDRELSQLSGGERYRLVLAGKVFAGVRGLEYELHDPGVTFVSGDAKNISEHIRFLRQDCGAEVEAAQLEACLASKIVIDNSLSIMQSATGAQSFAIGESLHGGLNTINNLTGSSGAGKSRLLDTKFEGFKRVVKLGALDAGVFKSRTVGALLGLAKPLKEFYANHPQSKVAGLKLSSFSGLLPGEKSRSTIREYELVKTVEFKGLSYDRTLRADVAELLTCFRHFPRLGFRLRLLDEMGLNFVRPIDRVKDCSAPVRRLLRLVEAMTSTPADGTLFILDDMLAGLPNDQLDRVLKQMQLLCERGATFIVTNLPISASLE